MKQITAKPPIPKELEKELATKAAQGDLSALEELVLANMRFVVKVAVEYQGRGLDLDDLVGEGSVALLEAARDFNPERDVKLITFAQYRIRAAIFNALAKVRVPIDAVEFETYRSSLRNTDSFHSFHLWMRTTQLIRSLPEKEALFVIKRYGLENFEPHTLSDLAHEMKMSTEGARQLEKRILKKLHSALQEGI